MNLKPLLFVCGLVFIIGCSKPLATARIAKDVKYYSKSFAADSTNVYAALRWAFRVNGYSVASENLQEGVITTTWVATTSDSHALDVFSRRDFGVNGAYYQLEARVTTENDRMHVEIGSRIDSVVAGLTSTGIEERKVLSQIGNYLRTSEPKLTNIGLEE